MKRNAKLFRPQAFRSLEDKSKEEYKKTYPDFFYDMWRRFDLGNPPEIIMVDDPEDGGLSMIITGRRMK